MTTNTAYAPVGHAEKFFIGGEWVEPTTDHKINVIEAATEELFYAVAEGEPADVGRAVSAARQAFDEGPWPRMAPSQRAEFIRAMARALEKRVDDMVEIWPRESGIIASIVPDVLTEVPAAFDYYADLAESYPFEQEARTSSGEGFGMIVGEPVGVVGAIIPWNTPMGLIAFKLAPALAAGCTVVLKASPEAPGAAYVVAEVAEEIGLPPGVVNVLTADREASEALVTDPRVDKIAFTGSTAVGKHIARILADRIGRYTLELGGKSAAVILDDMDAAEVAASLAGGACFVSGQICASLTRIVVPRHRHDEFVEALADRFSRITVGNPFDAGTEMGPLATSRQRDRVEGYVEIGKAEGAKLAYGGGRPKDLDRGWFIEPTVFGTSTTAPGSPGGDLRPSPFRHRSCRRARTDSHRQRLSVRTQRIRLHTRRRPRSSDRSSTSGRHRRTERQPSRLRHRLRRVQTVWIRARRRTRRVLPYLENKTVVLDHKPADSEGQF